MHDYTTDYSTDHYPLAWHALPRQYANPPKGKLGVKCNEKEPRPVRRYRYNCLD